MRVRMLQTHHDSLDGVSTATLDEGKEYELPNDVAGRILSMGIATPLPPAEKPEAEAEAEAGAKDAGNADENKDAGSAPENKDASELLKQPRAALNKQAKAAGVADPQKLPNKQAVAEAILAARA